MVKVVELFALLHDARRVNEGRDDGHGRRAAKLARVLWKTHFHLSDPDFELLVAACEYHTDGRTDGDVTVQTCWDADRLDLYRVGIRPKPDFLCTPAAKDHPILQWAIERSARPSAPTWITQEWEIDLRRR